MDLQINTGTQKENRTKIRNDEFEFFDMIIPSSVAWEIVPHSTNSIKIIVPSKMDLLRLIENVFTLIPALTLTLTLTVTLILTLT